MNTRQPSPLVRHLAYLLATLLLLPGCQAASGLGWSGLDPHRNPHTTEPPPTSAAANGWIDADTPSGALVVRYWGPDRQPGPYSPPNLIPPLQIWADGRIIWLDSGNPYYGRVMMEGRLPTDAMQALLRDVAESGFSAWQTRYAEAAPLPSTYLVIDLPGAPAKQVAVSTQGPPGFDALVETILALPEQAADARPYVPEQAFLWLHGPLPLDYNPDPAGMKAIALDVNAGDAVDGVQIEGDILRDLWSRMNETPAIPVSVAVDGRVYFVTVAVPEVSLCLGAPDPAFDVRWICPELPPQDVQGAHSPLSPRQDLFRLLT